MGQDDIGATGSLISTAKHGAGRSARTVGGCMRVRETGNREETCQRPVTLGVDVVDRDGAVRVELQRVEHPEPQLHSQQVAERGVHRGPGDHGAFLQRGGQRGREEVPAVRVHPGREHRRDGARARVGEVMGEHHIGDRLAVARHVCAHPPRPHRPHGGGESSHRDVSASVHAGMS